MLEQLVNYAKTHCAVEPGFAPKDVRWAIICDESGKFLEVLELGDTSLKRNPGRRFTRCPDLTQSELVSGKETRRHFLVDTLDVVVLYRINPKDKKANAKHKAFVKLLKHASQVMPELSKAASLLENSTILAQIQLQLEEHKVNPGDKITFRIGDSFPVDSDAWHDWWRKYRQELKKRALKPMRCLISGKLAEPEGTHPKIKGLADVGGRGSGDALISFDKDAFTSYGLKQSANAAISEETAYAYSAALNELIREHSRRIAGTKVVHWFKEKIEAEDNPLFWLEEGTQAQELDAQHKAKELLSSIEAGKRPDLGDNYYYGLTLSGASGRVMVRDWMEGQFKELVSNIVSWFDDLSIVHRRGNGLAPTPKFLAVLGATVRSLDDLPAPFVAKMWRVAVRGEAIPTSALAETLTRAKMDIIKDEPFNHARMGLMKAYHLRKDRRKGGDAMSQEMQPYLNENHPHPAYHCGRLMAVLAQLQHSALGNVGAGVVQRYYAAASTTPALVLGRLTRTSQFHLNKLEGGLAHWYEDKLAGIWGRIEDSIPATLTLEEQSLFALGYYQQLADLRTKKSTRKEEHHE